MHLNMQIDPALQGIRWPAWTAQSLAGGAQGAAHSAGWLVGSLTGWVSTVRPLPGPAPSVRCGCSRSAAACLTDWLAAWLPGCSLLLLLLARSLVLIEFKVLKQKCLLVHTTKTSFDMVSPSDMHSTGQY